MANTDFKWPRQWAAKIIQLPTREQRREALEQVPEKWRDWVRNLVEDYFAKRQIARRRRANTTTGGIHERCN